MQKFPLFHEIYDKFKTKLAKKPISRILPPSKITIQNLSLIWISLKSIKWYTLSPVENNEIQKFFTAFSRSISFELSFNQTVLYFHSIAIVKILWLWFIGLFCCVLNVLCSIGAFYLLKGILKSFLWHFSEWILMTVWLEADIEL